MGQQRWIDESGTRPGPGTCASTLQDSGSELAILEDYQWEIERVTTGGDGTVAEVYTATTAQRTSMTDALSRQQRGRGLNGPRC
jgi:hypothetical protein